MTQPRSGLISLADTPWYHLVSRCVRRAYLCGTDAHTGASFEHRRGWIAERLQQLASVFAIDVAAYAVMSNHYHIVLRVDAVRAQGWNRETVLERWRQLFRGAPVVQRFYADPQALSAAEETLLDTWVEIYRNRLQDVSWFMRVLNESIARQANAEDRLTGRFWEGRFRSQALLDEQAVLTAMAYVDLNPIRAKLAETPDASAYTSVSERIALLRSGDQTSAAFEPVAPVATPPPVPASPLASGPKPPDAKAETPTRLRPESVLSRLPRAPLMPFDATGRMAAAIPFALEDYLELVDDTGRVIRDDKRGCIDGRTPALLDRLHIDPEQFIARAQTLMRRFGSAVGTPTNLTELCIARQTRYLRGIATARALFETRAA